MRPVEVGNKTHSRHALAAAALTLTSVQHMPDEEIKGRFSKFLSQNSRKQLKKSFCEGLSIIMYVV